MKILNIPPFDFDTDDNEKAFEALPIVALPLNFVLVLGVMVAIIIGICLAIIGAVLALPAQVCLWLVGFRGFVYLGTPNHFGQRDPEFGIKGALTRKCYQHGLKARLRS